MSLLWGTEVLLGGISVRQADSYDDNLAPNLILGDRVELFVTVLFFKFFF